MDGWIDIVLYILFTFCFYFTIIYNINYRSFDCIKKEKKTLNKNIVTFFWYRLSSVIYNYLQRYCTISIHVSSSTSRDSLLRHANPMSRTS